MNTVVSSFAQRLHTGEWCVQRLPDHLGARRFIRETEPSLLGVAVQGRRRAIGLSAAIVGTPLELPVLAHECGHLLLGHDIGFCSMTVRTHWREERAAWEGAALLTIPSVAAVAFVERRATVFELADSYEVPRALVYMRGALAVLLDEVAGDRARARQQLGAARRSLESWMASSTLSALVGAIVVVVSMVSAWMVCIETFLLSRYCDHVQHRVLRL